jgi:hypothetical protein
MDGSVKLETAPMQYSLGYTVLAKNLSTFTWRFSLRIPLGRGRDPDAHGSINQPVTGPRLYGGRKKFSRLARLNQSDLHLAFESSKRHSAARTSADNNNLLLLCCWHDDLLGTYEIVSKIIIKVKNVTPEFYSLFQQIALQLGFSSTLPVLYRVNILLHYGR